MGSPTNCGRIAHELMGKDEKVTEKKTLTLPKEIRNIVKCKNPRCITSIEQELDQVFVLTDPRKEVYRCKYCEEKYKRK